jgi:pyruvate/2-oxoacid:ferredoxin oxidoreductase alpha subunit
MFAVVITIFWCSRLGFFFLFAGTKVDSRQVTFFHQVEHEVFEQDGTEITVEDAKREPDAKIATPVNEFFGATCAVAVGHFTNVLCADESEGHHDEDTDEIDDTEDDHCNEPEVEEDEDFLVDGVLREEAETVNVLQTTGRSESLHEAVKKWKQEELAAHLLEFLMFLPFSLKREESSGVLRESLSIHLKKSNDSGRESCPEAVEGPLHDVHVENLRGEKTINLHSFSWQTNKNSPE